MKLSRIGLLLTLIISAHAEEKQLEPKQEAARIVRVIKDNYGWASSGLVGLGASIALGMVKGRFEKFENEFAPRKEKLEKQLARLKGGFEVWKERSTDYQQNFYDNLARPLQHDGNQPFNRQELIRSCMNNITDEKMLDIILNKYRSSPHVMPEALNDPLISAFRQDMKNNAKAYADFQETCTARFAVEDKLAKEITKISKSELSDPQLMQSSSNNYLKPKHLRYLFYASLAVATVSLLYGAYKIGKYLWKRTSASAAQKVASPLASPSVVPSSVVTDKSSVESIVENNPIHPEEQRHLRLEGP
jgi:hypothetical protein